ncbi:MAG: hypothetical protein WCJ42_07720 [Actinomycetes bacterium]
MSTVDEAQKTVEATSSSDGANGAGDGVITTAGTPDKQSRWTRKRLLIAAALVGVLFALIGAVFIWYLITHKPISSLPGLTDNATPHYRYSVYGVNQPLGVAVNSDGSRIYATQSGGTQKALVFDGDGKQIQVLAPPATTGANHLPVYVALDPNTGEAYVSDRLAGAIYVYSATGKYERTFKHVGVTGVWAPLGMTFDSKGQLYVTQAFASTKSIYVFSTSGNLVRTITTATAMSFPNGVAVDAKGNIVVTDGNNGRALFLSAAGKEVSQVHAGLARGDLGLPRGVAFDSEGHVLIVDATDQGVRVYGFAGETVTYIGTFGDQGIGDGLFQYPNGIAADTRAHVYVTDRVNNRIQVWSY